MRLLTFNQTAEIKDFKLFRPSAPLNTPIRTTDDFEFRSSIGLPNQSSSSLPNTALISLELWYIISHNEQDILRFKTTSNSLLDYSNSSNRDDTFKDFIDRTAKKYIDNFNLLRINTPLRNHNACPITENVKEAIQKELIQSIERGFLR